MSKPMTGIDGLVAFVRARLADDEHAARTLLGATMIIGRSPEFYGAGGRAAAAFWQYFNPARMLAEVEAKRRILDRYEDALARQQDPEYSQSTARVHAQEYEGWIIPALAQAYAGRPGWREEWKL